MAEMASIDGRRARPSSVLLQTGSSGDDVFQRVKTATPPQFAVVLSLTAAFVMIVAYQTTELSYDRC
jgi:hypothetical protein